MGIDPKYVREYVAPGIISYDDWADKLLLELANASATEGHMIISSALEEAFNEGLFLS